ncbi:hypothetical protein FNAPI_6322 [Fusarium napiforme]|uniref:Uncharacterized protein n=1 Tax=Fusarium napiforme TaxID=42672 RepID=A0A8H5JHG9_9HYPO|nr:hypothetical protein FNAPI_6322 [Fusarium napiforme]
MSLTTLAPDLQVPNGQDVFTTNNPLVTQTPFAFISSSFGDANSCSDAPQHEELFDEFLDTVQRVERQLARVLAVWEKIARTLEN